MLQKSKYQYIMDKVKILVVDDHKIIRDGIKAMLGTDSELEVVGEAENGQIALGLALTKKLDIVLMDIDMPEMNGIEATKLIKRDKPELRIIALTMQSDYSYIEKMLKAGANSYLLKSSDQQELIKAIKTTLDSKPYFSQEVSNTMVQKVVNDDAGKKESAYQISEREQEVLEHIAQGLTNKEVADALFLSVRTVDTHRRNLLKKLDAKNSVDMVHKSYKYGILK